MRFALILSLVIAAVAIVFTLQNTASTEVNVGPYTITASLAVVLIVTLSAGVLVGLLAGVPARFRAGQRAKKAERELATLRSSLQAPAEPAEPTVPKVVPADPTAMQPATDAAETQRLAEEVAQRTQQATGTQATGTQA
ncbi:MAG: lipopolysaccharide assembly protein LapA domain-containing protein [Bacteroidota bacterium]